eukprot:GHVL01004430.1.p1 GENE.GHVL01004430.1~~GHVL01004430.1.p1  ORF type:complete len:435 (+),score=66.43 GHVL01004430.1:45-1349(+)
MFVEDTPDDPNFSRFLVGCQNNRNEALKRWKITTQWRKDQRVDSILDEPQPFLRFFKKYYPQYIHRKSKLGYFVYVERPGLGRLNELFDRGFSIEHILRHYVYVTEFCWNKLAKEPDAKMLTIFDATGATMKLFSGKPLDLLKACLSMIGDHFPERSYRILVINTPWWGRTAWRMISPFIDPRTRNKLIMFGSDYLSSLTEYVDINSLPPELGGKDTVGLGKSPEEVLLYEHVDEYLKKHNIISIDPDDKYVDPMKFSYLYPSCPPSVHSLVPHKEVNHENINNDNITGATETEKIDNITGATVTEKIDIIRGAAVTEKIDTNNSPNISIVNIDDNDDFYTSSLPSFEEYQSPILLTTIKPPQSISYELEKAREVSAQEKIEYREKLEKQLYLLLVWERETMKLFKSVGVDELCINEVIEIGNKIRKSIEDSLK